MQRGCAPGYRNGPCWCPAFRRPGPRRPAKAGTPTLFKRFKSSGGQRNRDAPHGLPARLIPLALRLMQTVVLRE